MVKKANFLFFLSFFVFAASALASQVSSASGPEALSLGPVILRMVLSLGFVLVFAFVVIFILRKGYGRQFSIAKQKTSIRVLARHGLDPKNTLFVVEVDGRTFLLGSGGGNLNCLAELSSFQKQEEKKQTHVSVPFEEKRLNPENILWQEKVQSLKKALHV